MHMRGVEGRGDEGALDAAHADGALEADAEGVDEEVLELREAPVCLPLVPEEDEKRRRAERRGVDDAGAVQPQRARVRSAAPRRGLRDAGRAERGGAHHPSNARVRRAR